MLKARNENLEVKFSKTTKNKLGYYVYALVDPRDQKIFYIGKASANDRAFDHLRSTNLETEKQEKISEIRGSGHEPSVELLRYGLESESIALEIEAAIIDAIGLESLTNVIRGHGVERGRIHAKEAERLHGSKPVPISTIKEKCILFFIHNTYSPTLSEQEIYDSTRQAWHQISEQTRSELKYRTALGIVEGVVVRAYSIAGWYPAGTTLSSRDFSNSGSDKWEFVGQIIKNHPLTGRMLVDQNEKPITASQKGYFYIPRT